VSYRESKCTFFSELQQQYDPSALPVKAADHPVRKARFIPVSFVFIRLFTFEANGGTKFLMVQAHRNLTLKILMMQFLCQQDARHQPAQK